MFTRRGGHLPELLSYLRLIDSGITQLEAQGPSGTCDESKEEEEEEVAFMLDCVTRGGVALWAPRGVSGSSHDELRHSLICMNNDLLRMTTWLPQGVAKVRF